jgi:hypothetical protein
MAKKYIWGHATLYLTPIEVVRCARVKLKVIQVDDHQPKDLPKDLRAIAEDLFPEWPPAPPQTPPA